MFIMNVTDRYKSIMNVIKIRTVDVLILIASTPGFIRYGILLKFNPY